MISKLAIVDPHAELVDTYIAAAEEIGSPIVAVFETHVQADDISGLPEIVEATGATAYLPAGAEVDFPHAELATATSSSWETRFSVRSGPRVTRRHTTRTWLPTGVAAMRSRGWYSPATRCSSATWAGRICMPKVMRSR